ncbi:AcrB/AcrD/AcrF family protein [Novosphingobium sp. ST904]|uniref:AcrB/AcrD/AcrF family protein n=1 Tax=Novosphingobium sp. ST904 TaxID=1684385 RepID=UPI00104DFB07|nr:AcrB/AcrD/AcrF family protein [Novosphingobium sp. ST904]TCM25699.1 hypothetical protein EDF59_13911 [Novosphingobium sp. ST904]
MPRVPQYQPGQVGPVQTTQQRFRAPDGPGAAGIIAEGLKGLSEVLNVQDRIDLENDETQSRLAVSQARGQYASALDQFKALKLGAARAGQDGFNTSLDQIKKDAIGTATSPRMRMLMEQQLAEVDSDARRMGASHALGQQQDETRQSFGIEQDALIDAAVSSDNPAFRDRSSLALRDSVARQLAFDGWDRDTAPDAYAIAEKAAVSKLHGGVLDRMFSSPDPDLDQVGQYLGAYRDEMTSDLYTKTMARMQGPLQDRIDDYRADLINAEPTSGNAPDGAKAGPWQSVAVNVANRFGLDPSEVAAVMSYETGGTFSPTIMGGKGGQYMGLIQFGPSERKKYGIDKASSPEDWTKAIGDYLQDRGFKRGMGVLDLYSTINAGTPGRYEASDGNGTVRSHVENLLGAHKEKAKGWLGGAAGFNNSPREWNRPAIYQAIEKKAAAERWSPEAVKRVKGVWDRRMTTDEGLLRSQQQQADEQAKAIALNAGDNFKVSMIPAGVRSNLSPVDLAQYSDAERRIGEAKKKAAADAAGKSAEWTLEAQARFDPDGFKGVDLKRYVGVIAPEALNGLATKQATLLSKPAPTYEETSFRSKISSEIEFQEKHNGVKLKDEQKVAMFDYISAGLGQVTRQAGKLPDQKTVSQLFQSGIKVVPGTGGWFGSDKRQFEVLTDVPDDFRQNFVQAWRGRGQPTQSQIVSGYQQWLAAGRP